MREIIIIRCGFCVVMCCVCVVRECERDYYYYGVFFVDVVVCVVRECERDYYY